MAVQLHPNAAIYRDQVAELEASLAAPESRQEAAEALRSLIDRAVLLPDPSAPDGLQPELHGDLAMILGMAMEAKPGRRGSSPSSSGTGVRGRQLSVVAGAGFEPAAFRL